MDKLNKCYVVQSIDIYSDENGEDKFQEIIAVTGDIDAARKALTEEKERIMKMCNIPNVADNAKKYMDWDLSFTENEVRIENLFYRKEYRIYIEEHSIVYSNSNE